MMWGLFGVMLHDSKMLRRRLDGEKSVGLCEVVSKIWTVD